MRIAILGNSGSGKSTLAKWLGATYTLPQLDLDTLAWEPGEVAHPRSPELAEADLRRFCAAAEGWVVEGCYANLVGVALEYGAHLLFLDPGLEACLANCRARPWEPHKYPSQAEQDERLAFLLSWVADYYQREGEMSHRGHQALFDAYAGPKQHVVELPSEEFRVRRKG